MRDVARFDCMRYPVVLFDFDGTLADTGFAVMRTVRRVMAAHGVTDVRDEDLRKMIGPPLLQGFMLAFGFDSVTAAAYVDEYRARFAAEVTPADYPPFPGVTELLDGLRREGRRLAVATSRLQPAAEEMLAAIGLRGYFEAVVGRDEVTRFTKADSIRGALARLGVMAETAVMVGDRFHDVEGAREAGCAVIGVYTGAAAPGEHDDADAACMDMAAVAHLFGLQESRKRSAHMDADLERSVDAYVDETWEDIVADIASLVRHPSVADYDAAEPGAPFGRPVRDALDCALGIAQRLGYEVSDDAGYVGMCDLAGERAEQLATIAHVDVVPAGPGWDTDPFAMGRREGWLLGRGVIDDKGPAVLSLYAGAYFVRHGITPRYSFRALLGCDEEVGMTDVHHYLEGHDDPAFLFTPDAEFPVCNAEKGCYGATFKSAPVEGGVILSWSGAEATNAIPSQSVCELAIDASELPAPAANADRIEVTALAPGRARVFARGIGGHASLPAGTLNAIKLVVGYLQEVAAAKPGLLAPQERSFLDLLTVVHADTDGVATGIATSSEAFGPLTCNAGTVAVRDGHLEQTVDIRFPDSTAPDELTAKLSVLAAEHGATLAVTRAKPAFSTSAESPAVRALIDTYNEVTGAHAKPFSMGGGTYARNFARAVSFGPEEPGTELPAFGGPMHGPNECASEELLRRALKIYILALLRLQNVEL